MVIGSAWHTIGRPRALFGHLPGWLRFAVSKLFGLACVLLAMVIATFLVVRLIPGDPARVVAGTHATGAALELIRHQLGLDEPLLQQFLQYLKGVFTLNLGTSFITGEPVSQVIFERFGQTAELAASSLVIVLFVGTGVGLWAAIVTDGGAHRKLDGAFTAITGILASTAPYVSGTLLVFVFAVELKWLPVAGNAQPDAIILPALAVSIVPMATVARFARAETTRVLQEPYIRSAQAKRLKPWTIYRRHVLPNVLTSTLTTAGIFFAQLMGGTVVVENLFALPGLGTALITAVLGHDYPVIQGVALFLGVVIVIVNAVVDLLLALINPRSALRSP